MMWSQGGMDHKKGRGKVGGRGHLPKGTEPNPDPKGEQRPVKRMYRRSTGRTVLRGRRGNWARKKGKPEKQGERPVGGGWNTRVNQKKIFRRFGKGGGIGKKGEN